MTRSHASTFLDRDAEREVLDRLIEDARGGASAALVIHGEAGMGIEGFADRARRALWATGETPRRPRPELPDELSAHERQIALLARDGLSNPEIGARLFLSPRTVEWHLRKVFAKLGISSRRDLARALPATDT